jgi:hypothetical protein
MPAALVTWEVGKVREGVVVPAFTTRSKRRQVFEVVMPVADLGELSDVKWGLRSPALVLRPEAQYKL